MRVLPFVLAPVLLAGCAHGSPDSVDPAETSPPPEGATFGFRAPEGLERVGFTRVSAQRFPLTSQGYGLSYDGDDRAVVDVYVYPVVPDGDELTDEVRQTRVAEELARGLREIHALSEREGRTVDDPEETGTLSVEVPRGTMEFLHRRVGYEYPDGRLADSHLLVGATGRAMVKMRSTFPSDEAAERRSHLEAFLNAFVPALEVEGYEGMAEFDAAAARVLPVPEDLPESFDFRIPPRLRSGWTLQGSQQLPGDAGTVAAFRSRVTPAPIQVLLRTWEPAASDDAPGSAAERFEAAWAAELERWTSEFESGLGEGGFSPMGDGPEELASFDLSTHYGPTTGVRARRRFRHEEGGIGVTHLAMTTVEGALVAASSFMSGRDEEEGEAVFVAFVEELAANLLATRPPPER